MQLAAVRGMTVNATAMAFICVFLSGGSEARVPGSGFRGPGFGVRGLFGGIEVAKRYFDLN